MSHIEEFMVEFRRLSMSRDRLFRLAVVKYLNGKSKDEIVKSFVDFGVSEEEAEQRYDKIVEIASEMTVRPGPVVFDNE